jgi:hypothetical protein
MRNDLLAILVLLRVCILVLARHVVEDIPDGTLTARRAIDLQMRREVCVPLFPSEDQLS